MNAATIIAILLVIAAVITLVPGPQRHKPCKLGYKAICTFSPYSTLILLVVAGFLYLVANIR